MTDVRGPDGKIVRFPDGTPPQKINEVMASIYRKPPKRSWGDIAHMAGGAIAGGIGDIGDFLTSINPTAFGRTMTNAITGPSNERGLYDAVVKAKGQEFADTHRQGIRDAVYGKSFGDRAYQATGAPKPVTRSERIALATVRGATGGALLGGPLQMGSNLVRSTAIGGISGAGSGAGSVIGGDAAGLPGALGGSLVGGGLGMAGGRRVFDPRPKALPPIINEGSQAGVRIMTSDIRQPTTFLGKSAQAIGERIPITGTGNARATQQAQRIAAVRNFAKEYGAIVDDETMAQPAINAVMRDLAAKRGSELSRHTNLKKAVIEKAQGPVPVPRTLAAIDEQIAGLQAVGTEQAKAVISKLADWRQAIQGSGGKRLPTIELIRKEMGDAFKAPELAAARSTGEKALSKIYGPMNADMGTHIRATVGAQGYSQWKMANTRLHLMSEDLNQNTLKSVLRTGQGTPEDVGKLLFSSKPSIVRRLYTSLNEDGRARAQAAIIQRALEKSGGLDDLSPDRFATQIKNLGETRGIFFRGNDLARIEGLRRVLVATQRASASTLHPATGAQAVPYAMGAGLTSLFGVTGGITTAGGIGLLARAYESAPVRNLLTAVAKSAPGSRREAVLSQRLAVAMNVYLANQKRVPAVANENVLPSLAASPDQPRTNEDDQNPY